jgi:tetratricopeptide (TPR) repeat protein
MDRDVETLPLPSRQEILGHIDSCGDNSSHYLTTNDSVLLHGGFVDGSQTSFATFYGRHDRYDDAEKLFLKSLELQNRELGPLHAGTLRTMNNLGAMYLNMGRLNEAAAMLQQTLDAKLKVLGPNDPLTLDTVNNMGNLYVMRAMFTQATEMYTRALQGYIDIYGHDHRSVVEALNNLGEVSMKTGDLEDAEHRFTAALGTASNTASDGSDSFTSNGNALVLYIKSNIAVIYALQGRSSEAIEVYMQVISGREKLLGPGHSLTLMSMCELADIYRDRGQTDEAELWYVRGKATMHRRRERPLESEQEKGNDPPAGSSSTISQPTFSSTAGTRNLPPEAQPPRLADGIMENQPREAIAISGSSNQEAELEGRNSVLNGINSRSTDTEPHHGLRSHVGATSNNAWDDQWVVGSRKMDDPEESLCRVGDSDGRSTIMDSQGLENLPKNDEKPSQATEERKGSLESAILHDRDAISRMPRPNESKDPRLHEEDQLREKMRELEEQFREMEEIEKRKEEQLRKMEEIEKRKEEQLRKMEEIEKRKEEQLREMEEIEKMKRHINVRRHGINKEHSCTVM